MGMYDEIKYKNENYQTKSLDCMIGEYEIKNDQLWCIQKNWKSEHEPFKMIDFTGNIHMRTWNNTDKKFITFNLEFINGNLVENDE